MSKNLFNNILIFSFGVFGLTALIYQVVFAKNLVLLFGLTAPAIATVLAVYFSGLALGSFVFGKACDRLIKKFKHHLLYIRLFVFVGVYGFFVPILFQILGKIIQAINQIYALDFSGFNLFAFLLSFLFLILPATFIGGGFSVISKILVRQDETMGKKISLLYFINALGSVFGAIFAGFWLIPTLGIKMTIFSASSLNLLMAGLLFFLFTKFFGNYKSICEADIKQDLKPQENISVNLSQSVPVLKNNLFVYILFLIGFLALALEVLYTKSLIVFLGSSTYAFSLILIIFLLGIALGSLVISPFLDRFKEDSTLFGILCGLLGFWCFVTIKFFEKLPFFYLKILQLFESTEFFSTILTQSLFLIAIILPATFLMGIIFPLGIKLSRPNLEKIGEGIGRLYFANTLGGVFGSLLAGFLFLPVLGFQKSLILIVITYVLLGTFFIVKEKELHIQFKGIILFLFVLLVIFSILSSPWSKKILAMGLFPYAQSYLGLSEEEIKEKLDGEEILFYKEGLSQVAVVKRNNLLSLKINGKTDASIGMDLEAEILQGVLPLILHPNPKEVLVIGLGGGITLGSVTQLDSLTKIEAVEIDASVIEALQYFEEYNHNALADPRVKMILADARNYLYLTDNEYDVVYSYPSNPWVSGNASLFTKEYYELVKSRLKDKGLMIQWVQYYNFWPEDLKIILKTFQEVFPQTYIFDTVLTSDVLLVGSADEINGEKSLLVVDEIQKKFENEKVKKELARIYITNPYEFLSYFVGANEQVSEMVQGVIAHTDDKPVLEFSAPKAIYQKTAAQNVENLLSLRKESLKFLIGGKAEEISRHLSFREKLTLARIFLYHQDFDKSLDIYEQAVETGLTHPLVQYNLYSLYLTKIDKLRAEGMMEEANEYLRKAELIYK